jgi:thiamine phosphate synthase YjbQ (UPF0047 family)
MKSFFKELYFAVPTRRAFVNITSEVEACLHESGIREGLLICNVRNSPTINFIKILNYNQLTL